ncbi:transglutaminase domain-containing protein [Kutzneria sp. NPDC052558]|uniref:transglutaminase domain-containing protein n=1 Tax=Kutzneria sp. NPDC052558 TaxID=3364121 RepID=UPI0037CBDF33
MDIDYAAPGVFTAVSPAQVPLTTGLPEDPVGICAAVTPLFVQPTDAAAAGVPEQRWGERNIRPASGLIDALIAIDPAPLHVPRPPDRRVVGTCRHWATLATALLRQRGIAARARCGFGTYFVAGKNVDHWVVEYREGARWRRVDVEHLGRTFVPRPDDLAPGEFLTGGEAWQWYRTGEVDGALFGVYGVDFAWGVGEIRANLIRDLASVLKVETLPWDEWGRMDESFKGATGEDFDQLMDRIAEACGRDDPAAVRAVYTAEDLAVPEAVMR